MSTVEERLRRRFSESIKQEAVGRIDRGEQSIASVSRELDVSTSAIYKWLAKYSVTYRKQHRMVVEKDSQENRIKRLETRIEELQAALGRKQLRVDYLEKLIEISEEEEGIDILKKAELRPWSGSESTDASIRGR